MLRKFEGREREAISSMLRIHQSYFVPEQKNWSKDVINATNVLLTEYRDLDPKVYEYINTLSMEFLRLKERELAEANKPKDDFEQQEIKF